MTKPKEERTIRVATHDHPPSERRYIAGTGGDCLSVNYNTSAKSWPKSVAVIIDSNGKKTTIIHTGEP